MNVGFLHVGDSKDHCELARRMVKSVRKEMPHARIIQMASKGSPQIEGIDEYKASSIKSDEEFMPFRLRLLAEFGSFPAVFLDTDILVKRDLSKAFEHEFDVGLTKRSYPIFLRGEDITERMPYNTGVMFSRGPEFFEECYRVCLGFEKKNQGWWGDQLAVAQVASQGRFKVKEFSCDVWNRVPVRQDDHGEAYVVHYKGQRRKAWMLA